MGVARSVQDLYGEYRPYMEDVAAIVNPTVGRWADSHGMMYLWRLKDEVSVAEKLESGRFESWSSINDLVAATVVVPTRSDEDLVLEFLDEQFEQVDLRGRFNTKKQPFVFRFDSTRWWGRIGSKQASPLHEKVQDLVFEIQIKTAFEWALGRVTHSVYKGDSITWTSRRLAALLHATVEQIDSQVDHFDEVAAQLAVSDDPETEALRTIISRLKSLVDGGLIDPALAPASWTRLAENVWSLVSSYTRSTRERPEAVGLLLDAVEARVGAPGAVPVTSGSLFQLICGVIAANEVDGATLDRFKLVPSQELEELYGVGELAAFVDLESA